MKNYDLVKYNTGLLQSFEVFDNILVTYNETTVIFYDFPQFTFLKKFDIINIEKITLLEMKDTVCKFLVLKDNNLLLYHNHNVVERGQYKNISDIVNIGSKIFLFTENSILELNMELIFIKKHNFQYSYFNKDFIGTKDGKVLNYNFETVNEYGKPISYIFNKNILGFTDGTIVSEKNQIKKLKTENEKSVIFVNEDNIVFENSHNGEYLNFNIVKVYQNDKKLFFKTENNELVSDGVIICGHLPISEICYIDSKIYITKDRSFRQIIKNASNQLKDSDLLNNSNQLNDPGQLKDSNQLKDSDLLMAKELCTFKNSILKMKQINQQILISDGESLILFQNDEFFILAKDFVIGDFDVNDKFITFTESNGDIYVIKNTQNLLKNKTLIKSASIILTKLSIYDIEIENAFNFNAHHEEISHLIVTHDYLISASKKKKIKIHDLKGNLQKEVKQLTNGLYANLKNNDFVILYGKKLRIYKNLELADEIETKNELISVSFENHNLISGIDLEGNFLEYNIKKKRIFYSNISFKKQDNIINARFKPISFYRKDKNLIFADNFLIHLKKSQKPSEKSILIDIKNKNSDLNYILEQSHHINIFEGLLQGNYPQVKMKKNENGTFFEPKLLSVINKENWKILVQQVKKYLNYLRYLEITQLIIKELIEQNYKPSDFDLNRIEKWTDETYRRFIGMRMIFKSFQ
ncbi:hypothetical protein M153_8610003931 [Pseudoloma neurophilia]|uniref:Uncharacterized protein n=1 Tax=Pseudoloma neurophilia TaxID=146866 RepID=A0A0R0M227_9MICR|nr:hypothetical protein M153_8610003931 [Pseudoloma neurophilia]